MEKLIELANAGVAVTLYGPKSLGSYQDDWHVVARKSAEGVELHITVDHPSLTYAITDLYNKWLSATGRGLPDHSLKQIEYVPTSVAIDDEIPF